MTYHMIKVVQCVGIFILQTVSIFPLKLQLKCAFSKLTDSGNSVEIFPLFLMIMITVMMWCFFKSQYIIGVD